MLISCVRRIKNCMLKIKLTILKYYFNLMMQARAQTQATTFTSTADTNSNGCTFMCVSQPLVLLFLTLFITTTATAMLSAAIMTDHWEHITWDSAVINTIINNVTQTIRWIQPRGKVAEITSHYHKPIFIVPLYGGIWTLCMDVTHKEIKLVREKTRFSRPLCINYLDNSERNRQEELRGDWPHGDPQASLQPHLRMQNLSISCSLVCLIILGSAALVGAFGVCQKQISAILITGIMYLLAALFALFTLTIIHYKRQHGRPILESDFDDSMVDGIITLPGSMKHAHRLLNARQIGISWSLELGWGGVLLCTITSTLWILLSKVLRYNPISAFAI